MVLRINNWTNPLAFIQASRLEVANICEQFGSLDRYSSDSLDLNFNREVSNKAKKLFCKFRGWASKNNSKIQINMHFTIYNFLDKMWFSVQNVSNCQYEQNNSRFRFPAAFDSLWHILVLLPLLVAIQLPVK